MEKRILDVGADVRCEDDKAVELVDALQEVADLLVRVPIRNGDGSWELYDYIADTGELANVAGGVDTASVLAQAVSYGTLAIPKR